MRHILTILALLVSGPAIAQVAYPPDPAIASKADQARTAAQAALSAAQAACQPMVAIPPAELVGGTAGSGQNCRLANAAAPRISRTDTFAVAGSQGMLTVTWDSALPTATSSGTAYASYPVYFTPIGGANTAPVKWKVISASNTGFTAQCMQEVSTLNFTLAQLTAAAITGLILPVSQVCPAGTQVYALQLPSAK